jgi:hypothetical protein
LPAAPARDDATIPPAIKRYATAQFAVTLALAVFVLWLRDGHPAGLLVASAAVILASLSALGGLLDGRRHCVRDEMLWLAATGALGLAYSGPWDHRGLGLSLVAGAIVAATTLAMIERTTPAPQAAGGSL